MLITATHLSACATYVNSSLSFRPPQEYGNFQNVSGLMVGGEAFTDKKIAEETFGFDIRGAGVFPVQIVIDNRSEQGIEIVPGQTYLIDASDVSWKILSNGEAVERVEKGSRGETAAGGAGKGGALLGLAIGVASGQAAGEAAVGGGVTDGASNELTGEDAREQGSDGRVIPAGSLARGFIYFSGEAATVRELRLQIRFRGSGAMETISLKFR
jgi:hypothetical protein